MRSIVTCPGCQRRLRMKIGPPGKRHVCPACSTPFVIGERITSAAAGEAEYLTFEVADQPIVSEGLEIIAPKPKPAPKPPPPKPKAPTAKHIPKRRPGPAPSGGPAPADDKLDVDFQLSLDRDEAEFDPLLPDDFDLIDESAPKPPPNPPEPPPPPPPAKPPPKAEPKPEQRPPLVPSAPGVRKRLPDASPPAPGVRQSPSSKLLANALKAAARPAPPPQKDSESRIRRDAAKPPPQPPASPEDAPDVAAPRAEIQADGKDLRPPSPAPEPAREEPPEPSPPPTEVKAPEAAPPPNPNFNLDVEAEPAPTGVTDDDLTLPADFLDQLAAAPPPPKPAPRPAPVVAPPPAVPEVPVYTPPVATPSSSDRGFTVVSRPAPEIVVPTPAGLSAGVDRTSELEFAERGSAPAPRAPQAVAPAPVYEEPVRYDAGYAPEYGPYEPHSSRANWLFAFWGVSAVLGGLGIDVIAIVIFILSGVIGLLGFQAGTWSGLAGAGILVFVAFVLIALQQAIALLGYGLCLGSPARGSARLWAVVTMCMAVAGFALSGAHFVLASSRFFTRYHWALVGLYPSVTVVELLKWVFFLIYLLALGRALRNHSVEREVMNTLKMTIAVSVVVVFVVVVGICAIPALFQIGMETGDPLTAGRLALIIGTLTWVIVIGAILLVLVRQMMLLVHVREKLADKIARTP